MNVMLKKWWVWAKNYYAQAQGKENLVIDNINILIPIGLTLFIIIVYIIWSLFGEINVGIVRNLVFMLASIWAFYGIIVAARRTAALEKQVKIQDRGQVTERLAKAAEQLSSTVMTVRILAILSLRNIAVEGDQQVCQDVIQVLCTYIRENRSITKDNKPPFMEDIYRIIYVLGDIQQERFNHSRGGVNFSYTDLSDIKLVGVDLRGAYLTGTNLSGGSLWSVDLSDANLSGANLSYANLSGANLSLANLSRTDLTGVIGLDTAKNLETVKNPPPEILAEIARRKQQGQK